MSNPLLRSFVEKVTEKSFDKGLFWGSSAGVFASHLYYKDKLKRMESKYYDVKHRLAIHQLEYPKR
jgi:hypothetical protein